MERLEYGPDDDIEVCLHIAVPETQNTITSRSQETVSPSIIGGALNVLTSVQLDYDPAVQRGEVTDIKSDLMLPSELEIAKLSPPQTTPEEAFGVGLLFAESASIPAHARIEPGKLGVTMSRYTTLAGTHDPSAPVRRGHLPI
jgi:hypothetical protein